MTISDSTLRVDVWNTIRQVLVDASLTIDTTTAGVKTAYNDKAISRPQVILYPANVSESNYKFKGKYGRRFIDVIVDCYANNTADLDNLSDQVHEAIRNALDDETLSGIDLIGVQEDYDFGTFNQQKFHVRGITFAFDRE